MLKIKRNLVAKKNNVRPGTPMKPTSVTIHSTGNLRSTARNERDNLNRPNQTRWASFHDVVDDKEVQQCIPHNEIAYHAGNTVGNHTSVGIEICESGDRDKTIKNAAEYTAMVLTDLGLGVDDLRRHYDWSGKICPRIWSKNGKMVAGEWIAFKTMVKNNMRGGNMTDKEIKDYIKSEIDKLTLNDVQPSSKEGYKEFDWADEYYEFLNSNGIRVDEKNYNDAINRGSVMALMYRMFKALK